MTKLFKIFINLLYSIFTMGLLAIVIWGANWSVNIGGASHDVPNLIENTTDDPNQTIYFSDVGSFTWTSIKNAHLSKEVIIDTSRDGSEKFWFIPVGWLNKGLTWTKNVFVAVLMPSYELEQVEKYRNSKLVISDKYPDGIFEAIEFYSPEGELVETIYFLPFYGKGNKIYQSPRDLNHIFKYEKYNQVDSGVIYQKLATGEEFDRSIVETDVYERFDKFYDNKPAVKWAFAEVVIIIVMTILIVYNNPIDFAKNDQGVTEIKGNIMPRVPRPRRREKKNRGKKHKHHHHDHY